VNGQAKDYKIGICCFSTKHTTLRRKTKDWLARNQNNVSEWSDMSTHEFSNFSATSWWEQVNFQWDDDEIRFVLDQHAELDFYRKNLLISANPCLNSKHILASMIYFDSDMSKSTNTVEYFDWKTIKIAHLGLNNILTWPPSFALLTNKRVIHSV
jgi:hypothetical protein